MWRVRSPKKNINHHHHCFAMGHDFGFTSKYSPHDHYEPLSQCSKSLQHDDSAKANSQSSPLNPQITSIFTSLPSNYQLKFTMTCQVTIKSPQKSPNSPSLKSSSQVIPTSSPSSPTYQGSPHSMGAPLGHRCVFHGPCRSAAPWPPWRR